MHVAHKNESVFRMPQSQKECAITPITVLIGDRKTSWVKVNDPMVCFVGIDAFLCVNSSCGLMDPRSHAASNSGSREIFTLPFCITFKPHILFFSWACLYT